VSKRPAFQFYPADWRTEAGLRLCSMPARGLCIEMMCLMHDATPYGHLTALGRAMTPEALARLVGEGAGPVRKWLTELEENEVFSRDNGVIFSRRMVRDEQVREARAAGGPAGGEHGHKGASYGAKGGRPRKEKPPLSDDQRGVSDPPPSSSSSSPSPVIDSVADATAENPIEPSEPVNPEKVMFDQGKRLLAESGIVNGKAGSLLGKWKRDHGAEAVIVALGKAQREGAIDPVSFIEGCFRNGKRPHHGKPSAWDSGDLPLGAAAASLD